MVRRFGYLMDLITSSSLPKLFINDIISNERGSNKKVTAATTNDKQE